MNLATKIAAAVSLAFAGVLAAVSGALIFDEHAFVEAETDLHSRLLGDVVASSAADTMSDHGEDEARKLVADIDAREDRIELAWLDPDDPESIADSPALTPGVVAKLRAGEVVGTLGGPNGETQLTYVPVPAGAGRVRVIEIAESQESTKSHVNLLLMRIGAGALGGLVLAGLISYVLGRRLVSQPVQQLVSVARQVGAGDLSQRAGEERNDELGLLVREVNRMTDNLLFARELAEKQEAARRDMEVQLRRADRLATVGQLASGVAHEIGTPLQSMAVRAGMIRDKAGHIDGVEECVEAIEQQGHRIATIVRNLLRFARKQSPQRAPCDLREAIENTLSLVQTVNTNRDIEIETMLDVSPCTARVDEEQMEQVVTNLVLNGIQAMPNGGTIRVGLRPSTEAPPADVVRGDGDYVCLFVEDEGTGIDERALSHLFDPFFTTKGVDQGTGLGLSICWGIVREHGGWIDVETSPGQGSRFSVHLPLDGNKRGESHAS